MTCSVGPRTGHGNRAYALALARQVAARFGSAKYEDALRMHV